MGSDTTRDFTFTPPQPYTISTTSIMKQTRHLMRVRYLGGNLLICIPRAIARQAGVNARTYAMIELTSQHTATVEFIRYDAPIVTDVRGRVSKSN